MNKQTIIDKAKEIIKAEFISESSGHDWWHAYRVWQNAKILCKQENVDSFVPELAALTHDIHRIMQNDSGKYCLPVESLSKIRILLEQAKVPESDIESVLHCVEFHEEYNFSTTGKSATDIETLIVQDADNLDAVGAIGIGRCFAYCGTYNIPMWDPEIALPKGKYDETIHDQTALHHFYNKLFRLKDSMNTKSAKIIAEHRHKVMKEYVDEFMNQWNGEDN